MVLVVVVDDGEATLAVIRQRGVDFLGEISHNIPGKRESGAREPARKAFYAAVMQAIREAAGSRGISQVLVVGPDLTRAGFKSYMDERLGDMTGISSISYDTCHSPGRTGIYEAIRRGAVERVVSESRVSREIGAVEDFLGRIARDMPAAYGMGEVSRAVSAGAVEVLLVTDEFFRSNRREADELIRGTESCSGNHIMISTDHEGGRKLQSLGGLGALLRYRLG
jgi:protein pelota